jgi:hypothetical protein
MSRQLGERQTEDLKVPGSIPGLGTSSRPARHSKKATPRPRAFVTHPGCRVSERAADKTEHPAASGCPTKKQPTGSATPVSWRPAADRGRKTRGCFGRRDATPRAWLGALMFNVRIRYSLAG